MLHETGQIIEFKMIDGKKTAIVECVSKSACKACSNNDNCGVGVVAKKLSDKFHRLSVPYKEGMELNESIELLIENKDVVQSSTIVYLIPLILFVLGSVLGHLFLSNEPLVIAISLLSLFIGVLIAKAISSKLYPHNSLNKLISTK